MLLLYLIVWKTSIVSRETGNAFEGVTSHFHVRKLFRGLLSHRPARDKGRRQLRQRDKERERLEDSVNMIMAKYDYLIVGSGLFGATFAYFARKQGKKCLVIDKRLQLGGNVYCENIEGINVHKYGAHIFHTSNKKVWDFVNSIVPFNRYTNSPVANFHGKLYNLPFNMNTFYQMWGVTTPEEAQRMIASSRPSPVGREPRNLEEKALQMVGKDIYEKLVKEYTEKQWGRDCKDLPPFIISRLPLRFVFDNNYFNDAYQGIPIGGYNRLIEGLGLSPTLPRREGESPSAGGVGEAESPSAGGVGEAPRIDCLVGVDVPLNKAKYSLKLSEGGYRKTADPVSYKLLEERAKEHRKNPTEAEDAFWKMASGNAFGVKFRRQHVIDNYIVDFVSLEGKLVVEIDGGYHFTQEQQIDDNLRSQVLKDYGFTILRLKNEEVIADPEEVKAKIKLALWLASLAPLRDTFSNPTPDHRVETSSLPTSDHRGIASSLPTGEGRGGASSLPTGEGRGGASSLPTGEGRGEAFSLPSGEGRGAALVYTGRLDEFFDYQYGKLDWRTVSFKTRIENVPNYQGNAVVNYTSHDVPYTRVIEHKHFESFGQQVYDNPKTVVSEEYSTEYKDGMEPYYPVNDEKNNAIAEKYRELAESLSPALPRREGKSPSTGGVGEAESPSTGGVGEAFPSVIFGGRLAEYKYYDMAPIIEKVMKMFE
jgi:UDP-galactopyranose mutase/very-short-patch-repair endonuclease